MNLVIVESPAKAKTIEKFLGKDFKVVSCFGHISDLPSKELGVNVDGDFNPNYIVSDDKKKVVKELKLLADKAETVWLASDEDREGEAIAWHLNNQLKLSENKTKRIVFREITKTAILKAVKNPRQINNNLVDAQQARRVLDRLVGYELSPILWRKVKGGLSAGRVQSVSVRILVEREREIEDFVANHSFKVHAEFPVNDSFFKANCSQSFGSKKDVESFLKSLIGDRFLVMGIEKKPSKRSPSAPFITSTLQQESSRKLSFSVSRTMSNAQRLYESGLITYMRTDSTNLSNQAQNAVKELINEKYGSEFLFNRSYKTNKKGAQEAHEAVRPTNFQISPTNSDEAIKDFDQKKLYDLIWRRTVASQMSDAKVEISTLKIQSVNTNQIFTAKGEIITFEGFMKVYFEGLDNESFNSPLLPNLVKGSTIKPKSIISTQRFTKPPSRFTEASLVKKLEELGIGRPSTYAPTITTIIDRKYVEKGKNEGHDREYIELRLLNNIVEEKKLSEKVLSEKGKLVPTDVGMLVNDFLVKNFSNIVDYNFTAKIEENFDSIADGNKDWKELMKDFYKNFHPKVEFVSKNAKREIGERVLGIDPKSGRQLSVRLGKFGPMAQIGVFDDDEKPLFASLNESQQLNKITFEEALDLFKLPLLIGHHDDMPIEVNNGRYGPYLKYGKLFVSIPKLTNPLSITKDEAVELIEKKIAENAPIYTYDDKPVTKGKGRFGPFIKWNNTFINVSKNYDFDLLSDSDIVALIEEKKKKDLEKIVKNWSKENITIEKARWGRHNIIKGKLKIQLPKNKDVSKITLEEVQAIIKNNSKSKKSKK